MLVAAKAADLNRKGVNAQAIHEEIRQIPTELNQLYSDLLNSVDASDREQTEKLFQWVLCAQRPLRIAELREALALDSDTELPSITCLRTSQYYCDSLQDTERRIKDLSKGLIEIKSREIFTITVDDESFIREAQFIHQSVPDFLVKGHQVIPALFEDTYSPVGAGHSKIARACVMYLGLAELWVAAKHSWYHLTNDFPLADYAAQFLHQHISKAEAGGIPQTSLLPVISEWMNDSKTFKKILHLWDVLHTGSGTSTPWPTKSSNIWHFIAWCGISSALDFLWRRSPAGIDKRDCLNNTPLLLAIQGGHDKIASELLNWIIRARGVRLGKKSWALKPIVNPNATNNHGATAMGIAIERNATNIVRLLVKAGASLFGSPRSDCPVLSYAMGLTHDEEFLSEIVERMDLGRAISYISAKFPLTKPSSDEKILRGLLKPGTSESVAQMCELVSSCRADLMQIFLDFSVSREKSHDDNHLRLALQYQSREFFLALVSYPDLEANPILEYMFRFEIRKYGETLQDREWIQEEDEEIMRLLIHHKNVNLNQMVYAGCEYGRTPMVTAAIYQDRTRSLALLLESDSVWVDFGTNIPPYFPYASAPVELRSITSTSARDKEELERTLHSDDGWNSLLAAAPVLTAAVFSRNEAMKLLLQTGRISEATIVEAFFVAQLLSHPKIMESLQKSIGPSRCLYRGGPSSQHGELWIGPANDSDKNDSTESS